MAQELIVPDLWRTQLCRHGAEHSYPQCRFAHRLCDLRAPNEMARHYDNAWRTGAIDRWFGQAMTVEQQNTIVGYWKVTPDREVPPWVCGLRFAYNDCAPLERDRYQQWDYDLTMDLEMLCFHRHGHGPLPITFMTHLWPILTSRRNDFRDKRGEKPVKHYDMKSEPDVEEDDADLSWHGGG